jgi:hypothetical protein
MSAQIVLLPVFVLVGLIFALLLVDARRGSLETRRDMTLNQSELPLLFYVLIALALPLRFADLFIVLMSLGVRGDGFRSSRNFRDIEQRPATLASAARGSAGAFRDVDLLRAEDSFVDIAASRVVFPPWGPLLSAKELRIIC